ncbi:MAG TPA: YqeG family HAD IIIA-type phosphatase [Armatimonadota bacterium]|nr:YqeG family HAD IIIA-type phosphatase [Armatimonadota bacterium]
MSRLLQLLCPNQRADALSLIDLEELKSRRIEALLLDLDNTLVPWRSYDISPQTAEWVGRARECMKVCIVSNSRTPKRMQALAEQLGISYARRGAKPRRAGFREALYILGVESSRAAVIGDQIFTDILGGNRLGAYTILVRPIHRREFVGTKVSRLAERVILRMLERRGMMANQTPIPTSEGEQMPSPNGQKKSEQ